MLEQVWRPNLEVAGLLGRHGMTDGPALVLNASESDLCGKGVNVGYFVSPGSCHFPVVSASLRML